MSVERHADAAADDIENPATHDVVNLRGVIARHMQSAVDEATEPLKARIDELETLNQGYRFRCHSAERDAASSNRAIEQWKESDAILREKLEKAKARITQLEGLGPLIDLYGSSSWNDGYTAAEGQRRTNTKNETKAKIDAILKGES